MSDIDLFQIGSGWFPESKGGAENVFYNIYDRLKDKGFSVRGVVPGSRNVSSLTNGMIDGFAAEGVSLPKRAMAIRRSVRRSFLLAKPNIVASHFAIYCLPTLDQISGTPLVCHFHGPWAMESLVQGAGGFNVRAKKAVERFVYQRAKRVIVLSEAFSQLLQEHYQVPESIIRVIPGGVNCDLFDVPTSRDNARKILGWDPYRPIMLSVRRLVPRMGLDRLITAMQLVRRSNGSTNNDAILYVVGSGPERAALEALVRTLGLSDTVRFAGHVTDDKLALAYRAADLTIVPTAELEGFGLIVVESLACGTPVLVTPVGGLPDVVAGLSEAMILGGADPRNIADGINVALGDPAFLPSADSCRSYARAKFDWNIVIPQIASVYREVL